MPDDKLMFAFALANVAAFYTHVEQAFAFLPATYNCQLHAQHLDDREDFRDARASVMHLGDKMEVDIRWDFASAIIRVVFVELPISHVSPTKRVAFGEGREGAREISLELLTEVRRHPTDPDLLLGDLTGLDGRSINRRFKVIQSNLGGVIGGLARATERYASEILRGDTSIFPAVMRLYGEKRRAQGFW